MKIKKNKINWTPQCMYMTQRSKNFELFSKYLEAPSENALADQDADAQSIRRHTL